MRRNWVHKKRTENYKQTGIFKEEIELLKIKIKYNRKSKILIGC